MGKTYSIRKVEGGGVSSRPLKKKKMSVGLFSTFRHPLVLNSWYLGLGLAYY